MLFFGSHKSSHSFTLLELKQMKPNITPAEMVYGSSIQLPGDIFEKNPNEDIPPIEFVSRLRTTVGKLQPVPVAHHTRNSKDLDRCTHVFMRHDAVRPPLQAPYDGPYEVKRRFENTFVINVKGKEKTINIQCLKPAHLLI